MFKVGQDVICIDSKHSNHLANGETYKVVQVCYGGTHLIVNRDGYTGEESTYSVNRFEVAAGHRIETETLDHPENHISPKCKITEAHVNEALKLNQLG
ncbi:hypothetical protein MMO38_06620 [Acinetobacter sp. NIPH 1852]|uniref:hypothetical protein n=1 Tax=Acinetobacter sp. NIPH 1852 TaxID=2923428 RepID=UPI001F4B51B0|nr:hypothetical protein [Acinetobacter sp. NIPH 1852]MCH7307813.1 hypothetical protein [Acinetobacter sp. NIPH 1852]